MDSRKFWLVNIGAWLLFGLFTGVQVFLSMLSHGHSPRRLIGYFVLVWLPWTLITAFILAMTNRWPLGPPRWGIVLIHIAAAFLIGIVHSTYSVLLHNWMLPFDRRGRILDLSQPGVLLSEVPVDLILYATVLGALHAIAYYRRAAKLQASLNEARLQALELQLQPHFLFNTLNAIAALVRTGKNEESVRMIAGLSDLLRYALDRSGVQRVTLDEESTTLRRYLEIQRVRFADRLAFHIDVPDDVKHATVPIFILQPLAENALKHGIALSAGEGTIDVRAFRENTALRIEVFNTGFLDEHAPLGIGLRNTIDRLREIYGRDQHFDIRNDRGGVLASISIPWSEAA